MTPSKTSVVVSMLLAVLSPLLSAAERPNIVLIMADDMGYENLSLHGSEIYETPNLDKLAASGMWFRNAHSQPICTASRVQIMTGIYNNRNYIEFGILEPGSVTFANILRDSGYRTCIAGKWQLLGGMQGPLDFGFDRFCLWQLTRRPSRYPNPGLEIDGEEKDFRNGEFGPDVVTDYINDFMTSQKDAEIPFLVYYPMMLPHNPFVPTPGSDEYDPAMWRDATREPGFKYDHKYWKGFVEYTDKMVGKVVNKLEELGLRENTLVIFTCDNGTNTVVHHEFQGRMMKGGKASTLDSGTHVPFIASWPAVIKPGQVREELVDFSDVLPTLAEAGKAEGSIPDGLGLEGQSLAPLFRGEDSYQPRETIYTWYHRDGVRKAASQNVRTARYKLYADGRFHDTHEDPEEKTNLAKNGVPEELKSVHARLEAALRPHLAITAERDPVQAAKRSPDAEKRKKKGAS